MGLVVMAGVEDGGDGWRGWVGNKFPVCVTGVGNGGVGAQGSMVATEN